MRHLSPDKILFHLKTKNLGRVIYYFDQTNSTQTKAKEFAAGSPLQGTLVMAERQTSGKGRFERAWHSGSGGLWFSLILRAHATPSANSALALVTGLCVAECIKQTFGIKAFLKWPNDVLLKTAPNTYKKVCGILVETSLTPNQPQWMIVGIGINANNSLPANLQPIAVSLKEILKTNIERTDFLQNLLLKIEQRHEQFLQAGFNSMRQDYLNHLIWRKQQITIANGQSAQTGELDSVSDDGEIILKLANGHRQKFIAGETSASFNPKNEPRGTLWK